jgi:hypothetical protein
VLLLDTGVDACTTAATIPNACAVKYLYTSCSAACCAGRTFDCRLASCWAAAAGAAASSTAGDCFQDVAASIHIAAALLAALVSTSNVCCCFSASSFIEAAVCAVCYCHVTG